MTKLDALVQSIDELGCETTEEKEANCPSLSGTIIRATDKMLALATQLSAAAHRMDKHAAVDASSIRTLIAQRRIRNDFFDPTLFADPAWDIMLDLAAAQLERRAVSISSLCIAAAVPTTTALRHINAMRESGLLEQLKDPLDGRKSYINLTPKTFNSIIDCLHLIRFNLLDNLVFG